MSKIQKHIEAVLDVKPKRGEDRQDFLVRVAKEINNASDDDYAALGKGADGKATLEWYDGACDALEAKKPAPDFPDAEAPAKDEAEDKPTRRRAAAKEEQEAEAPAEPKVGDKVKVVTKRDKTYEGKVVEIDDEVIVVDVDGEEEELQRSRLASIEVLGGSSKGKGKADADEPADPVQVGATVTVVTKRGKEYTGEIVELDDEVIVVKTSDGEEEELQRSRVESITPVASQSASKGKGKADEAEDKPTRRKSAAKDEGDEEGGRASAGVGVQLRQMLVDELAESGELPDKAEFLKIAKKKFPDSKDNTLGIVHGEVSKLVEMLKKAKLLKA